MKEITEDDRMMWKLALKRRRAPEFNLTNCRLMLEDAGIGLWYDVVRHCPVMDGDPTGGELDIAFRLSCMWAERFGSHSPRCTHPFVFALARMDCRNPVADWLDGLEWDGADHIGELMEIAAIDQRDRATLENWLAECALTAHNDGSDIMCEPDRFMVLVGPSGCGKSLLSRKLVPAEMEAYLTYGFWANSRELALYLTSCWLITMQDIDSIHGTRLNHVWSIMRHARRRIPYGYSRSNHVGVSRTVVFFESTKPPKDTSRYVPIHMGQADIGRLADYDVTQVWAQVMHDMQGGI